LIFSKYRGFLSLRKYHEYVQNGHNVLGVNTIQVSSRQANEATVKLLAKNDYSSQGVLTTFNCWQMIKVLVAGNLI